MFTPTMRPTSHRGRAAWNDRRVKPALARHRLGAQRLVGEPLPSPADVIGHLGAVQSQLHDMALWGIGRRCGATLSQVTESFERGDFVRTHVLRPTWHDVLKPDLRDLLELTAPRIVDEPFIKEPVPLNLFAQ